MSVLAFLCPFMYMSATLTGVLNGLGQTRMALLHNVICVGLRIGFIVVCVPKTGVLGYLWGLMAGSIALCGLHFFRIAQISGIRLNPVLSILAPLAAALAGGYCSMGIYRYMMNGLSLPPIITIAVACMSFAVIYMLCLYLMRALNR